MKTQRIPTLRALMALLLVLPACLSASDYPHRPKSRAQATLRVSNNKPQTVYVVLIAERSDGWAQWPLGTIEANDTRTFQVTQSAVDVPNIRIVATAFSNWKDYKSKRVTLRRGRQVDLALRDPAPRSVLATR